MRGKLRLRRHQRWIALSAVAALLFSQVVFASHFCRGGTESASHARQHSEMSVTACVNAATHMDDDSCKAHCSHPDDGNQQGKVPSVASLAHTELAAWTAVIDVRVVALNVRSDATHRRKPERWRLHEFCTLLL